jgi:alpha-D-ribose 1-methylphosphonate 5-triphosphate synthase subunit PhnL
LRKNTMGYVSQFLRAVPRVPCLDVVAEPLMIQQVVREEACVRAGALLHRLNIPERLWPIPPATFSGGEQQRVNIARGFLPDMPILLLDEPTASLDAENRAVVVDLIAAKKKQGAAIVAIVHDDDVRRAIADTIVDVSKFSVAA